MDSGDLLGGGCYGWLTGWNVPVGWQAGVARPESQCCLGDWRSVDSCAMCHHQAGQGPVPGESMTQPHGRGDSCVTFPRVEANDLQRHAIMFIESFPQNLSGVKHQ